MIEVIYSESETESMKVAKSIASKHTVSVRTIKDFKMEMCKHRIVRWKSWGGEVNFMMRIIHKTLILSMLLAFVFSCSGCGQNVASGTSMEFSFNTSTPADSNDEKTIYICKDMEKLELNAKLNVDSGNVTIQVVDTSSNETVWNYSYSENTDFKIELTDLKADSEYLLKIATVQSEKVTLTITTEEKLVKDKNKPDKYNIEKK